MRVRCVSSTAPSAKFGAITMPTPCADASAPAVSSTRSVMPVEPTTTLARRGAAAAIALSAPAPFVKSTTTAPSASTSPRSRESGDGRAARGRDLAALGARIDATEQAQAGVFRDHGQHFLAHLAERSVDDNVYGHDSFTLTLPGRGFRRSSPGIAARGPRSRGGPPPRLPPPPPPLRSPRGPPPRRSPPRRSPPRPPRWPRPPPGLP